MVVALMGLFVFTILHVNVKPYDAFVHDKLEILSLLVSQVTLFIGLLANFFKEDQNSDKRTMTETEASSLNYTLGAVIALVNLLFVVYFVMPKSVRTRLNRCCGCFCRRCKQCQDTADDLQEKVTGKRRASKRKFMDEFDSEAEKGREMHDTHS